MDDTAEEHNRSTDQQMSLPACSSPLSSPIQTWLPIDPWKKNPRMQQDQDSPDHHARMQWSPPSPFYEELFCTSRTSSALVPLAGALMSSNVRPQSDVVKQGYLGKQEHRHRRYFVLRGGSHTGPSRLEWYKSQEKFTAAEKATGKSALFGSTKQCLIYLRCCLGVSRISSPKKDHAVTLYAKDQTVVLVVEDQWEQEEWYQAIKKLMEEERKDEEQGERLDEEDDGYCTLPPAAFFKEAWPVTVKPRGLGCSKSLAGESRLCLTVTSLILIKVGACCDLPSVTIPLLSVRRFGHLDGSFFLELGRSAPNGPGEIWMEAREQVAQHIHEVIRETVKDLRALPDFSRSPISNHNQLQSLLSLKRCRPKHRDKLLNVRPLGTRLSLPLRTPEIHTSPTGSTLELQKLNKTEPESSLSCATPLRSHQSSVPETSSYMEMKTDHHPAETEQMPVVNEDHSVTERCKPSQEEEGLGYMLMSPQVGSSSFTLPQDDYMTMASPQKHDVHVYNSLQTSFSSSISDSGSPIRLSNHHPSEHSPPKWPFISIQSIETKAGQSQGSICISTRPQDEAGQEEKSAEPEQPPSRTRVTSSPVRSENRCNLIISFPKNDPGCTSPVQVNPNEGVGQPGQLQAASDKSVRRSRLSLCLLSCFKAEDKP
ncbi:insulin receptor substrate 2-A-like isoform X2 [Cheilinus undulatus]|uniref:insulin receptor substrate 2-A-like isoform X2 n=1 Tax=Cheilinus undulatus TaxID=241271 RepID=UPI001BD489B2|nr:insulin receptor substrate 2-A-like isoform X2 [Cheilinus undulatus]